MRRIGIWVAVSVLLACAAAIGQDFQKTYPVSAGGRINVSNISGDIQVIGYDGASVLVSAYFEGRDRDCVEIEDSSSSNSISLKVRYPRSGSCDAGVRFVLQVPRMPELQFDSISTASGNVEISSVAGNIQARTASGDIRIRAVEGLVKASTASGDVTVEDAAGAVSASTASGDVDVELVHVEGTGDLAFSSASGDVVVRVPAQIDAEVRMSTASGSLKTDFPLTIEEREDHGRKAFGLIGAGSRLLKISTASGNVSLVRS
jgi:hypothetical protein